MKKSIILFLSQVFAVLFFIVGCGTSDSAKDVNQSKSVYKYLTPELSNFYIGFLHPEQVSTESSFFTLSGVCFGTFSSISIIKEGEEIANITDCPLFFVPAVALSPGVNRFTLEATDINGNKFHDSVRVIFNTGGYVPEMKVKPNIAYAGQKIKFIFSIDTTGALLTEKGVELWRSDENGKPIEFIGNLFDDGDIIGHGDELKGDGVYSTVLEQQFDESGNYNFLTALYTKNEKNIAEKRISPSVAITVFKPVQEGLCSKLTSKLAEMQSDFGSFLKGKTFNEARDAFIEKWSSDKEIISIGASVDSLNVWVIFSSGIAGVIPLEQFMSDSADYHVISLGQSTWVQSKIIKNLTAYLINGSDELKQFLTRPKCPSFLETNVSYQDNMLPYQFFKGMNQGIIYIKGKGDIAFGGLNDSLKTSFGLQPNVEIPLLYIKNLHFCDNIDDKIKECSFNPNLPKSGQHCDFGKECAIQKYESDSFYGICLDRRSKDLKNGSLVLTPDGYAMAPRFFKQYLPESMGGVVLLDFRGAVYNSILSDIFLAHGNTFVAGTLEQNTNEPYLFIKQLIEKGEFDKSLFNLRFFGASDTAFSSFGLYNGDFELPDKYGWQGAGDERFISSLGSIKPVSGKTMAIISTGLGFSEQSGSMTQVFCPAVGTKSLSFHWLFASEEFKESCGIQNFNDTFTASLTINGEQTKLIDATINSMCGVDDGQCGGCPDPGSPDCTCGQYFNELIPADFAFDAGDVFYTNWNDFEVNISAFAGISPIILNFKVIDRGDSNMDSAVLIDGVREK